jgi:biopolymer transport protein ExbB
MFDLFLKGGPVMWPLLITSLTAFSVVIERSLFLLRTKMSRRPDIVKSILVDVQHGNIDKAIKEAQGCRDYLVTTLVYGLIHREDAFSNALMQAASIELKRFSRGLVVLDTTITIAPLLGLLGTVTGMIHAFGLLGSSELQTPTVITGGIAQALIATACGLGIAIIALIPFNFLNARLEEARHEIEQAATHLELLLLKLEKRS